MTAPSDRDLLGLLRTALSEVIRDLRAPPEFLDLKAVAKLTGLSKRFLESEIAGGRLRVHRFGRAVRVSRDSLDRWIGAGFFKDKKKGIECLLS